MRPQRNLGLAMGSTNPASGSEPELTPKERNVMRLVSQGFETNEIARDLFMSERAVESCLTKIYDKVGVTDRLGLALYAVHMMQAS